MADLGKTKYEAPEDFSFIIIRKEYMAHTIEENIHRAKREYLVSLKQRMLKLIDDEIEKCDILIDKEQRKIPYDNNRN